MCDRTTIQFTRVRIGRLCPISPNAIPAGGLSVEGRPKKGNAHKIYVATVQIY
jgi:hypothetical protein